MTQKSLIYFIFIIFSFSSCSVLESETSKLETYLKNEHGLALNEEKTYYILLPCNHCKNCFDLNKIRFTTKTIKNVVIISSLPKEKFKRFERYYYDKECKMYGFELIDYSPSLIITQSKKVEKVVKNILITDELIKINNLGYEK